MPGSWTDHPGEDTLDNYAMGNLDDGESDILEQHLLVCEDCRNTLAECDHMIALVREIAKPPAPLQTNFDQSSEQE